MPGEELPITFLHFCDVDKYLINHLGDQDSKRYLCVIRNRGSFWKETGLLQVQDLNNSMHIGHKMVYGVPG